MLIQKKYNNNTHYIIISLCNKNKTWNIDLMYRKTGINISNNIIEYCYYSWFLLAKIIWLFRLWISYWECIIIAMKIIYMHDLYVTIVRESFVWPFLWGCVVVKFWEYSHSSIVIVPHSLVYFILNFLIIS